MQKILIIYLLSKDFIMYIAAVLKDAAGPEQ
jgi:hypothetical protein